jgi:hypothetical protein
MENPPGLGSISDLPSAEGSAALIPRRYKIIKHSVVSFFHDLDGFRKGTFSNKSRFDRKFICPICINTIKSGQMVISLPCDFCKHTIYHRQNQICKGIYNQICITPDKCPQCNTAWFSMKNNNKNKYEKYID